MTRGKGGIDKEASEEQQGEEGRSEE